MIVIPADHWGTMVDRFAGAAGLHACVAFLDGVALGPEPAHGGVVTTVTLPDADCQPGGWRVEAGRMSAAGSHLRAYRLVRLAQVHAHPGPRTSHGEVDDRLAYSQRAGAVSIVLPTRALTHPGLGDAAVHVRERSGWRQVPLEEVDRHVQIVPSTLDLRPAHT